MTKAKMEALMAELAILRQIEADPVTKSPKGSKKSTKGNKVLSITQDEERSNEYGDDRVIVKFLNVESRHDFTDVQNECKSALVAVRWGAKGNGKFRFNKTLRAFTGLRSGIPTIVTKNNK
jgi:hypothetical protein